MTFAPALITISEIAAAVVVLVAVIKISIRFYFREKLAHLRNLLNPEDINKQ